MTMKRHRHNLRLIGAVIFACLPLAFLQIAFVQSAGANEPIAVFTSSEWEGDTTLDIASLRKIYLGKRTRIFGTQVRAIHMPLQSPEREVFRKSVLKKSQSSLNKYWLEQALSGGYLPPREFSSLEEIIRAVLQKKGSLGYANHGELLRLKESKIRILRIRTSRGEFLPGDPGYPLQMENLAPDSQPKNMKNQ